MKNTIIIIMALLAAAVGALGVIYYDDIRGVAPAVQEPPADIADLINQANSTNTDMSDASITKTMPINQTAMPLDLPSGFSIAVYAQDLGKPRDITRDAYGTMLVSLTQQGSVVALPDDNGDAVADNTVAIVENLRGPHGILQRCEDSGCKLYIAEEDQLAVYDYDVETFVATNKTKLTDLPAGDGHSTRGIMFDPADQDRILISVGSSCNVCEEDDWRRAAVLSVNTDGTDLKEYATGLRNAVFMNTHPVTDEVWATEMGRDWLGDNTPPEEINIVKSGNNYGWPYCYGNQVYDEDFGEKTADYCRQTTAPYIAFQAHAAPLGLDFIPAQGWPDEYQYDLLVAYHGSWNRTVPTGYKLVRHDLDKHGKVLGTTDFITGWLADDGALGRPVDILAEPGGKIFVSDDKAGVIYYIQAAVTST